MMGISNIFDSYNMISGGNTMSDDYNMIAGGEGVMDENLICGNIMGDIKYQLYV